MRTLDLLHVEANGPDTVLLVELEELVGVVEGFRGQDGDDVEGNRVVLEQADGAVFSLPPIEIVPAEGAFDYAAKYLLKSTQEICPGRFSPETTAEIMDQAIRAHRALSCTGYSRTDFIVSAKGPIYLETNTLPGLTPASLYPKALKAQGIDFADFLRDQIVLAEKRGGP